MRNLSDAARVALGGVLNGDSIAALRYVSNIRSSVYIIGEVADR
jgi:hypothetical protein